MAVLTPPRQSRLAKPPIFAEMAPAAKINSKAVIYAAFAAYVTLVAAVVSRHEAWFDEAQAWLLARDAAPLELFTRLLPNEGSPGLWHLLLLAPAKLGMPYQTLNWISAALGAAACLLVLRYSPFPLPVKLVLPFSFFLFYQYTVVARSYALLAPLLFGIALAFRNKDERPLPFFILLALLANVSAHGLIIAASLGAHHAFGVLKDRKDAQKEMLVKHITGLALLGAMMGGLVLQLAFSTNMHFEARPIVLDPQTLLKTAISSMRASMLEAAWPSAVALAASLWWFWRRRVLFEFGLLLTVLFIFFSMVYRKAWHDGIPFLIWVFVMWISLDMAPAPPKLNHAGETGPERSDRHARLLALASLFAVCIVQIGWSAMSWRYDYQKPYSGSKAAADYIQQNGIDNTALYGINFPAVALLPYFEENIFDNLNAGDNPAFWDWSRSSPMYDNPILMLQSRPHYVLLSIKMPGSLQVPDILEGYKPIACFPGAMNWKTKLLEVDAYMLLENGLASDSPPYIPPSAGSSRVGCESLFETGRGTATDLLTTSSRFRGRVGAEPLP